MIDTLRGPRTLPVRATVAALFVAVGAAGPLPGCASLRAEEAAAFASVADRVLRGVARANESARVTAARKRCGEIEQAAALSEDAETAATLLRELAEAQKELADALDDETLAR